MLPEAHQLCPACYSSPVSTPEQQKEVPPESPGQATVKEGKTTEKVDQDLPTDAEHKPVVQGEAEAPIFTSAVSVQMKYNYGINLGPVVLNFVSLTSLLRPQLVKLILTT